MIKKNYTIFLFILILIFLSINQKLNIIPSLRFSNIENLQDYGSKTQAFSGGPLPYSSFVDYLKEPEDIKNKKLRRHFKKIMKKHLQKFFLPHYKIFVDHQHIIV